MKALVLKVWIMMRLLMQNLFLTCHSELGSESWVRRP